MHIYLNRNCPHGYTFDSRQFCKKLIKGLKLQGLHCINENDFMAIITKAHAKVKVNAEIITIEPKDIFRKR